jgi:hypothetical protein
MKGQELKVIKEQEEILDDEQLEAVEGGKCTCDCWIANSNNSDRPKKDKEGQEEEDEIETPEGEEHD